MDYKINVMHRIEGFISTKIWEFFTAVFLSVLGYFSPLKNIAHLVLFFFLVDIIYGYLADRKRNDGCFKNWRAGKTCFR
jgi:hypothetical protein